MKFDYRIYFVIGVAAALLFVFLTRKDGSRNYIFLGATIGAVIRGVYEMNKKFKPNNKE